MSNSALPSLADPQADPLETLEAVTPLYQQLAERIRRQIYTGEVEAGQQIPTEAELIARYGVSHITVRRAMQELSNEGLLVRTRGKGTFVNPSVFTGVYNYLFIHGFELDGLAYPFTSRLLNGICRQNSERVHFRLEMLTLPPRTLQEANEDRRVDDLLSHTRIHGIIALPRLRPETMQRLMAQHLFIVQIGLIEPPPPGVVAIDFCTAEACRLKARHLQSTGRRRIGFIAQPDLERAQFRTHEFQTALQEVGLTLEEQTIEPGRWGVNGGREAAGRLLERCPDLDVLVASDDLQALGALLAAQAAGRKVPDDLAILGQGNMLGEHSHCGLTTVDTRIEACGALAVQTLERLLKGQKVDPIIPLAPRLIIRQTG